MSAKIKGGDVAAGVRETLASFGSAVFSTKDFIDRYRSLYPDQAAAFTSRYGAGGKGHGHPYSANSRFGAILRKLTQSGELNSHSWGKAPAGWGNGIIRLWSATEPGESDNQVARPTSTRNPPWNRDELILALNLYLTNPQNPPSKSSQAVSDLSALLNKLHRLNGSSFSDTLRNENGVYLKMMNLRALDPEFTARGKVGMSSGGKLEREVWIEYEARRAELAADARAIRETILNADESALAVSPIDETYEAEEGGVRLRVHRFYERDRRLVMEKKKQVKACGKLACEVCQFDFEERYGSLGADFIEVHHLKPVHTMKPGDKTSLSDLALLCSNCHRMTHRRAMHLTVPQLRDVLRQIKS